MKPKELQVDRVRWAKRAIAAVADWTLTGERGRWTLVENGKLIATWREADAPGLSTWIAKRLPEFMGAAQIAEPRVRRLEVNPLHAAVGGKKNRRRERALVERAMRAAIRTGQDPVIYLQQWHETYGYSIRHLRNILNSVKAELSIT